MSRRPDPALAGAAAERVAAVLERTGGWVPPPVGDEPAGHGPGAEGRRALDPAGPAAASEPPAAAPAEARSSGPDEARVPDEVPPPGSLAARAERLLPGPLRGGRVDPGRSGAMALVAVAVVAALVAGVVLLRGRPQEVRAPEVLSSGAPLPGSVHGSAAPGPPGGEVVVAVAGKVRRPGLVRLPVGARVDDAVRAAGGLVAGASPGLLNLARRLVDGEQVLVGVDPPPGAVGPAGTAGGGTGGLLDLNAATVQQLEGLPGVGPVLAERIVEWRTEHTRFGSVDQLREVSGIGESKYSAIKSKVRV